MRKLLYAPFVTMLILSTAAEAQFSGTPSYSAPYRAFTQSELGVIGSIPGGADIGVEGVYRVGQGNFDLGFRGGVVSGAGSANDLLVIGAVDLRQRVITHSDDLPLDGAVVLGAGGRVGDINQLIVGGGLSLGRRVDLEDSNVSISPFFQPTLFGILGDGDGVGFTLGFGSDFRVTQSLDLRVHFGLGDIDGASFGLVWTN